MRLISLFLVVLQMSLFAQAAAKELKSRVERADIVCANVTENLKVSFNTSRDQIWLGELTSKSDVADEVQGKVYQGINSPDRFTGEVLGEIVLNSVPMYISLILRDVNGQPSLEGTYYEQKNSSNYRQFKLDCTR